MPRASVSGWTSLIGPDSNSSTNAKSPLFRGADRGEAAARKRLENVLPGEPLVVPGEGDLAHQVRVRGLETLEALERGAEPHDAALAPYAGDLDRVGLQGHASILRELDEATAHGLEAVRAADLELLSGLVGHVGRRCADTLGQLAQDLGYRHEPRAVGMDQLRLAPEAEGSPAVLRVESAVGRPVFLEPRGHCLHEARERLRRLEPCRLVRDPDLERAEAWMRANVPPDPRDLVGEAERDEALDELLPLLVAG